MLYGRIPGYGLSERGRLMAAAAAADLVARERPVSSLYASPLQRAQESAQPISEALGLPIVTEDRIIEPTNWFEGTNMKKALALPKNWWALRNPRVPSWGEPYTQVFERMMTAIQDAWATADSGDVVLVSHQLPIVMVQRGLAGEHLYHDPRKRRCELSSITTLERRGDRFVEVGYATPAQALSAGAKDVGAV